MRKIAPVIIGLQLATSAAAYAGGIQDRQTFQLGQIEQGRQDGSITWREGLRLRAEQQRITRVRNDLEVEGGFRRSIAAYFTACRTKPQSTS